MPRRQAAAPSRPLRRGGTTSPSAPEVDAPRPMPPLARVEPEHAPDSAPFLQVRRALDCYVQLEYTDGWRRPLNNVRVVEVWDPSPAGELLLRLPGSVLHAVLAQYVVGAMLQNAIAQSLPPPPPKAGELSRTRRRRRDAKVGPHAWVGDRIARVRGKLELDWEGFARRLGCSRMTVARAERGECLPKPATLQRIAVVGDVSLTWLLTGKEREG